MFMKKLEKLTFNENLESLNDNEMKMIGGGGAYFCCFNDGECVLTGCTSDYDCQTWYGEGWCD